MKMEAQIRLINMEHIIPNRFQPRLHFDEEALKELSASIVEHGIIQPLVLRRVGDKYEIIAGERRYKAAQMAGLTSVPAIITDLDDNESAEVAILENTQRKNLSPIEEGKSYKKLLDRHYVTQDQLAKRLGTSQSNIANKIRLLSLDESVQDALLKERISERHARSLLKITDKFKQVELLNKIIEERWTVKRLDEEIAEIINAYNIKQHGAGGISINNKLDVDVDSIMKNASDLEGGLPATHTPSYTYTAKVKSGDKKKDLMFGNSLENEEVNMDPTLNFGFNPFKTAKIDHDIEMLEDDEKDYEVLEADVAEEDNNIEELLKPEETETKKQVEQVVVEKEVTIETMSDAINAIKDVIKKAKANEVGIELEEFGFDDIYQFIIRIDKNNND